MHAEMRPTGVNVKIDIQHCEEELADKTVGAPTRSYPGMSPKQSWLAPNLVTGDDETHDKNLTEIAYNAAPSCSLSARSVLAANSRLCPVGV